MKSIKSPTISVILSVYNQEKYIESAIQSILNQTFKDFELIIINDASTDKTANVLRSYKDPRVKRFNNKKQLGLAKSLNKAISLSRGKFIARMDADDIAHPMRFKKQIEFLRKNPKVALCGTAVNLIDLYSTQIGTKAYPSTHNQLKQVIMRFNPIIHPTIMLRRSCLSTQAYDPSLNGAEDYDLYLRVSQTHQLVNLKEKLLDYRINPRGISFNTYNHTLLQALKARLKALSTYHYPQWQYIYLIKPALSFFVPVKIKKYFFLNSFPIQSPNRHAGLKALSKQLLPRKTSQNILDIGCGSDATYKLLKSLSLKGRYTGIDIKFKAKPQPDINSDLKAHFIETSFFKLSSNKKFDLILSLWNLEHIKNNQAAFVKIKALLKQNGRAIIIVPSLWTWPVEFGRHGYHYYTKKLLKDLFHKNDFKIVKTQSIGGIFGLIFAIIYQWLAYLVLIPSLSLLKLLGKLPKRQTKADIGSAELSRKILSSSIYAYQKTKLGRWLHMNIIQGINFLDKILPLTPSSYLVTITK